MRLRPTHALAILTFGIAVVAASGQAQAQHYRTVGSYGSAQGYGLHGAGYAFAGETVRGGYIGAPLTRFPRPSEIVPAAWTYGTYGIPTVAGIERAPMAPPSLTIVNAPTGSSARRARPAARILHRDERGGWMPSERTGAATTGVHIVEVQVPRR